MNNPFILRRRGYQTFQGWKLWLQIAFVISTFVSIAVMYVFTRDENFFSKSFVYVPFVMVVYLYFQYLFLTSSKLEIDDFGLSHQSNLPDFLKQFQPDWRISWSEIKSVERVKNGLVRDDVLPLNLNLLSRTIKIMPLQWVDPKDESKKPWFTISNNFSKKFQDNVLVKIFEKKGFLDINRPKVMGKFQNAWVEKSLGTDVNSSPISLGMTIFIFSALFYFVTEVYFTLSEFYATTPPYLYLLVGAVIAAVFSFLLLLKTKFTSIEKIVLSLMMGAAMAVVMYPLMLRINEWTDTEGLHSYSYTKSGMVRWTSDIQNKQIPASLKFDLASSKYWAQFEIDDTKEFELRKGGLGFYQLNMEPIYEEQREFYRNN